MDVRIRSAGALAALFLFILVLLARPAAASQAFLDLIIETGDAVGGVALAGADPCTAQAFNEVKTALRKGRLSGGGDWVEADEETTLQGACPASRVDVFWFKRTGKLLVRASLGCSCTGKGPADLEGGTVRFFVPVQQTQRADGSAAYRIGAVGDYTIEAKCCMSRRAEPRLTVFDGSGARKTAGASSVPKPAAPGVASSAPQPAAPSAQPTPPSPRPAPVARPEPRQPPRTAQPAWSEQNPCPECAKEKEIVDYFAQRLAGLDIEMQTTQEMLDANDRKRLQAQHRIDDIDTRLDDEQGTGGESYDPNTGITVRSYDQGDGSVKVDTLGPDNQLIDSYSYPRRSSQELVEERAEHEAEVKAAEAEAVRLRRQLIEAKRARDKAQADLDQASRALRDCIAVRCGQATPGATGAAAAPALSAAQPQSTAMSTVSTADGRSAETSVEPGRQPVSATAHDLPQQPAAPAAGCDGSSITQPVDAGAVSDYKGLKTKLEGAVEGLAGKALGGLFGGGGGDFSIGGGGMDIPDAPEKQGPDTEDDPIDEDLKQSFTDPETGVSIKVGVQRDGDRLLISTDLDASPDNGTFQAVVLEDAATCKPRAPTKYVAYDIKQDWSLDLWWSHTRTVDGQVVEHESGSSHEAGVLDHGRLLLPAQGGAPADTVAGLVPAWQYFGYRLPYGGVQSLGAEFDVADAGENAAVNFAVHVTREQADRIRTVVFPLHVVMERLGRAAILKTQLGYQLMLYRAQQLHKAVTDRPTEAASPQRLPGAYGGGGTQIDPPSEPPPAEDILEEIDTPIVIN